MQDSQKTEPTSPRKLSHITNWDYQTDIAIVGFGGAGACAAIEAADAGAAVIVFELGSDGGGSTALSSGELYMGGNGGTPVQQDCGFEDSTEDMFNYMMKSFGSRANEEKIRIYCEESTEHFRWLTDHGIPFKHSFHQRRAIIPMTDDGLLYSGSERNWPFNKIAKPCPRGHAPQIEGDNCGTLLFNTLAKEVKKRNVTINYEARVLTLIVDDDNSVHGLVVRMNQKEYTVKTRKGVILCNGGFCMNQPMIKKYAPKLARGNYPVGNPGDTGSGILMGMGVGASAINMDEGFISMPLYPPAETAFGILVNSQGQRFVSEDLYHSRVAHNILIQPEGKIFMILHAGEDFSRPALLNADIVGTGETIEELEEELELPHGMLKHTVEFYNKHAEQGEDPLFHKTSEWLQVMKAPYVALDCTPGRGVIIPFFTFGGLETLPTGEVLNLGGKIIPGLYAAGRTASGVPCSGEGYSSGTSVGDATFSGRKAGKSAAAREV